MTITNKYLKKSIEEMSNFLTNNTQLPEDLVFNFIVELRVSNLLIPAVIKDSRISFPHLIGENGLRMLPLFTDETEFSKYTTDLNPVPNEFGYYQHITNNLEFDGIVVNCEGDEFFIDKQLMNGIPPLFDVEGEGPGPEELKRMAAEAANDELLRYIRDDRNFNRTEGLLEILKGSVLMDVVMSDEDISEHVKNGTLSRDDVGGFVIAKQRVGRESYTLLFTGIREAEMARKKDDCNYYYQVADLYEIIRFTLTNDLDGIIINPGLEEYYIRRHTLIMMLDDEDLLNTELATAADYAFEF